MAGRGRLCEERDRSEPRILGRSGPAAGPAAQVEGAQHGVD